MSRLDAPDRVFEASENFHAAATSQNPLQQIQRHTNAWMHAGLLEFCVNEKSDNEYKMLLQIPESMCKTGDLEGPDKILVFLRPDTNFLDLEVEGETAPGAQDYYDGKAGDFLKLMDQAVAEHWSHVPFGAKYQAWRATQKGAELTENAAPATLSP